MNLGQPVPIEAKDNEGGGDNWTTGVIVVQSSSQIITTNKPTPSFLQAGCPSWRPTNSVKALNKSYQSTEVIFCCKIGTFKCDVIKLGLLDPG